MAWHHKFGKLLDRNRSFWLVAIAGVILDQATKLMVMELMVLNQSIPLWDGVFHLTYVTNPGAAFSLFQDASVALRWISLAASLGLIALGLFSKNLHKLEKLGYGLILAGAVGNGIDRFAYGYVIDFLELRFIRFPVFNFADVCINIGLLFLLWLLWKTPDRL